MKTPSAYQNDAGEWVYPQEYYKNGQRIAKKQLLDEINSDPLVQEAIRLEPFVGTLIKEAAAQRCVYGYNAIRLFYDRFKPQIVSLVGFKSPHQALRTMKHYDAVYQAIYNLLPNDEVGLYSDAIMPNGMFSPTAQEKYEREYP